MYKAKLVDHQLSKSDRGWSCSVCDTSWKRKPGKTCPGCRVISKAERREKYLISEVYRAAENLRLLDRVWAYKSGNNWEISYDSQGKTEPFYPGCKLKQFDRQTPLEDRFNRGKNSLKNIWGLKKLNLVPGDAAAAYCYWDRSRYELLKVYRIKDCRIKDTSLPPVLKNIKSNMYAEWELEHYFNLEPIDKALSIGCLWDDRKKGLRLYYKSSDCRIKDPSLPQVYVYKDGKGLPIRGRDCNDELVRGKKPKQVKYLNSDRLKTAWIWEQMYPLYQLKSDAKQRGCLRGDYSDLLYSFKDLELHDRETYLSKTKLKQTYHLPPSLIKLLDKPDKIEQFEIDGFGVEGHMYLRSRVELMISQNADAYIKHLQRYNYPLPVLDPKLQEIGRKTAKIHKIENNLTRDERLAAMQQSDLAIVDVDAIIAQAKQCTRCASSSLGGPAGFICVIYPMGIGIDKIPCPDFSLM